MNNAAGCEVQAKNKFVSSFDLALNPVLPDGEYSGIAKIKGDKWGGGKESSFFLNIEISKPANSRKHGRRDEF